MKRIWLMLILMLVPIGLDARELTIEQACQLARTHSYRLKRAAAESEAARATYRSVVAGRLPTLSAQANASYISEVATLNIEIPGLGGLSREMGTKENYQADLRLSVPLFTGGRLSGGIDQARASREYYEALENADLDRLHFLTRTEYLTLARSTETAAAVRASMERTEVILRDVESLHAAGAADSVDLLEAQLAVTTADLAVRQAENDRRATEIRLADLLGLPADESLELTSTFADPQQPQLAAMVSDQKPEILAADASVRLGRSSVKIAVADYLPTISAYGGYSYGKPNLDRFNNTWNDYVTVGANLSWSFSLGGGTRHRITAARQLLSAARSQRDIVVEDLSREARLIIEQVRLAYRQYATSLEAYRLSDDNFRLSKQQHANGAMSTNRLLETETRLTAAQASLAAARIDYHIALTGYYYATGSSILKEGY